MVGPALRVVVVLAYFVVAPRAFAEPNPEAEKLFRDGRKLIKDGKIAEACDAFSASSHMEPSVGTFLNLGDCRARLEQTASAWAAFVEAARLAHKLNDSRSVEADKRSGELEPRLSYMTITVATKEPGLEVARNGLVIDASVWSQSVPVDPGTYSITAKAPNHDPWTGTLVIKPDSDHESIAVPPLHARPIPVAYAPTPPMFTPKRKAAVAVAGVGVAAGVVGIVLTLQARSLEDEALAQCPDGKTCHDQDASDKSRRALSRANLATYIGGAGVALIGAGVVLWFVGRPHESAQRIAHVVPVATPDSLGFTVVGSF
jgi:hypothetical protein